MMIEVEGNETMQVNNEVPVPAGVSAPILSETEKIKKGICPSCDGGLVFQEGCKVCYGCGWGGCE
jgi:hypothetical protein